MHRPDGLKYLAPSQAQAFLGLVRAGDSLARGLSATLQQRHGIGLHAFEVLLFLAVFSPAKRLRMSDLTHQAPLSQSRVSRLVADLESAGLVVRKRDEDDGRGISVSITDSGLELFKTAQETHLQDLDDRLFSRLSKREIADLGRITAKLLDPDRGSSPDGH